VTRLTGVGVLVTRPEHQAGHLCQLIEAEGGAAVRYPALVIRPRPDRAAVRAAVGPADRFDLVVFVSANAVRYGADILDHRRDLAVAAVGQATAAAINGAGYRVSLMPEDGADSESLLALPQLAHMSGQRVLIVRGSGGRELLSEVLTARGAQVQYAEVYTREPARPSAERQAEVETMWRQGGIKAYAATSVELLEALVGIVTQRCRELMDSTALVTGSRRVAEAAARLGLGSPVVLADSPDDAALIGGGTGYAPLKAIVRAALESGARRDLLLYWGARTAVDLYDDAWLRELAARHARFRYVPVTGRLVHEAVLEGVAGLAGFDVYAAGPPAMIDAVRATLPLRGADPGRIYFDSFDYAPA